MHNALPPAIKAITSTPSSANRACMRSIKQTNMLHDSRSPTINLDLKNPHISDTGPGAVDHLLPEYEKLLAQIDATRAELKAQLQEALTR